MSNTTTFYIIEKVFIIPEEHHNIFSLIYDEDACLINLLSHEIKQLRSNGIEYANWLDQSIPVSTISLFKFLKPKHTFEITRNFYVADLGFNFFNLSNDDIMYLKLMRG